MLVFWSLALWFWTTAARGAGPADGTEGSRNNAPTTIESDDEQEIERRATGIFSVQADSPRPRDTHAAQELTTQPYTRARHRRPPAIGEGDDVR